MKYLYEHFRYKSWCSNWVSITRLSFVRESYDRGKLFLMELMKCTCVSSDGTIVGTNKKLRLFFTLTSVACGRVVKTNFCKFAVLKTRLKPNPLVTFFKNINKIKKYVLIVAVQTLYLYSLVLCGFEWLILSMMFC